jgi:IclR family acetate operon transcriptional repressor
MVLLAGPEETLLRTLSSTQGPLPVHLSAAGRAILARLPDPKVDEVLERSLPRTSDGTGEVLERHVRQSVAEARRDGYSLVRGEYVDDLGVVAAAVVDGGGAPVAALAVMVPRERIDRGEGPELGALLVEAAESVSLAVQAAESTP